MESNLFLLFPTFIQGLNTDSLCLGLPSANLSSQDRTVLGSLVALLLCYVPQNSSPDRPKSLFSNNEGLFFFFYDKSARLTLFAQLL